MGFARTVDGVLSRLYRAAGYLAAVFLMALAALVLASIVSRLAGVYLPGVIEYSGYAMAASSFLALAYAFGEGSHIRVGLLVNRLRGKARWIAELWCLGAGALVAVFLAAYSSKLVWVSFQFEERSEGADATLLWIPQTAMALGALVFALCLVHVLLRVMLAGRVEDAPPPEGSVH